MVGAKKSWSGEELLHECIKKIFLANTGADLYAGCSGGVLVGVVVEGLI